MRALVRLWALALCACGPIQSRATLVDAVAELSAARAAQAEIHAPFELVAAEVYLEKARQEQSYADFETAVRFAEKSRACAEAARRLAMTRAKASFGVAEADQERIPACRPGPDRGPDAVAFDAQETPAAPPAPVPKKVDQPDQPVDSEPASTLSSETADPPQPQQLPEGPQEERP